MRTALITGVTGQDGQYLSHLLLEMGYKVFGAIPPSGGPKMFRLPGVLDRVVMIPWSMTDIDQMTDALRKYHPAEVYNFAALSSGTGMYDTPVEMGDVNGLAVTRILEAIRVIDPTIRFCQASSSEMYGEPKEYPQTEKTPFNPRSPYGVAKLYAHMMIQMYRRRYGLFACSAILYNHESPLRGYNFVTRKITHAAASIKLGLTQTLELGDLDACRDWGFAGDVVRAMWQMLQATSADDYIIATGISHSVRDVCEIAFSYVGLDYREYVHVTPENCRPRETIPLIGDSSKLRRQLEWCKKLEFCDIITMMVDEDLHLLQNDVNALK